MPDHPAHPLITSDRVNGAPVYGAEGRQVGTIDHLVIEKLSGRIVYAVMSHGGLLGLGQDHYPIPWAALSYDTALGGYRTGITEDQLRAAPAVTQDWSADRRWEEAAHSHFGLPFYWI